MTTFNDYCLFAGISIAPTFGASSVNAVLSRRADCVEENFSSRSVMTVLARPHWFNDLCSPHKQLRAFQREFPHRTLKKSYSKIERIMLTDAELNILHSRWQTINDDHVEGKKMKKQFVKVYTEFHELLCREIKQYEYNFNRWVSSFIHHWKTIVKNNCEKYASDFMTCVYLSDIIFLNEV